MYDIRIKITKGKEAGEEIQDKIHDLIINEDLKTVDKALELLKNYTATENIEIGAPK